MWWSRAIRNTAVARKQGCDRERRRCQDNQSSEAHSNDVFSPASEVSLTSLNNATVWGQNTRHAHPLGDIKYQSNVHITFGLPSITRRKSELLLPSDALVNIGVHVSVHVITTSNVQHPPGSSRLACGYSRDLSAVHSWPLACSMPLVSASSKQMVCCR